MENKIKKGTVFRITVDERISEDLIRLEICELIQWDDSLEFKDEPEYWTETIKKGNEILVRPPGNNPSTHVETYASLMGIPSSQVNKFPWKDLKEGQVFLSGAFEVKTDGEGKGTNRYFVVPGAKAFEQIDDDVKKNTKSIYYEVLAKSLKNG